MPNTLYGVPLNHTIRRMGGNEIFLIELKILESILKMGNLDGVKMKISANKKFKNIYFSSTTF